MKDPLVFRPDPSDVLQHPALRAIRLVGIDLPRKVDVDRLQHASGREWRKSALYRVHSATSFSPLVAKRAKRRHVDVERVVYEAILPDVPCAQVRYHGSVADPDPDFGWLVLEYVEGDPYAPDDPVHQKLAANWFATFHAATARAELAGLLPDCDLPGRRTAVETLHDSLRRGLGNAAIGAEDRRMLESTVSCCVHLLEHWGGLVDRASGLHRCVVHGDFIPKNVIVRGNRRELLPLDWDCAGFGLPAEDLARISEDAYAEAASQYRDVTAAEVGLLVSIGRTLQAIDFMAVRTPELLGEYPERALQDVRYYSAELTLAVADLR